MEEKKENQFIDADKFLLQRWELDPASSECYKKRVNHEGEYEGA